MSDVVAIMVVFKVIMPLEAGAKVGIGSQIDESLLEYDIKGPILKKVKFRFFSIKMTVRTKKC